MAKKDDGGQTFKGCENSYKSHQNITLFTKIKLIITVNIVNNKAYSYYQIIV